MGCSVSNQRKRRSVVPLKEKEPDPLPVVPKPFSSPANEAPAKTELAKPPSPPVKVDQVPYSQPPPENIPPEHKIIEEKPKSTAPPPTEPEELDDINPIIPQVDRKGNQSNVDSHKIENAAEKKIPDRTAEKTADDDDFDASNVDHFVTHKKRLSTTHRPSLTFMSRKRSLSSRRRSSTLEKVEPFLSKINKSIMEDQIPAELFEMGVDDILSSLRRFSLSQPLKIKNFSNQAQKTPEPKIKLTVIAPPVGVDGERKELAQVLSLLESFCMERRIYLTTLDSRAFTNMPPSSNQFDFESSFRDSRQSDYFLFFIGSKYGWIPDGSADDFGLSKVKEKYMAIAKHSDLSDIEYELRIMTVKSDTIRKGYAYFKELDGSSIDSVDTQKISNLKTFLSSSNTPHPIITSEYKASSNFLSPFIESFKEDLGTDFPLNITPVDFDTLLGNINDQICRSMSKIYRGRARLLQELLSMIDTLEDAPLVYSGPPGIGKTALMSKLHSLLDKDRTFIHYVGQIFESINIELILNRILVSLGISYPTDEQNVLVDFPDLVRSQFKSEDPFVIIIDDIDRLDTSLLNSNWMTWIPNPLPKNLKIIITCSHEFASSREMKMVNCRHLDATQLENDDVEKISVDQSMSFKHFLSSEYMTLLIQNPHCRNPLFLKVLLGRLRIADASQDIAEIFESIKGDCNIRSLIMSLMDEFDKSFSRPGHEDFVLETISALCLSKTGFRERDLQFMFGVPYCIWSPFFSALSMILSQNDDKYVFMNQVVIDAAYSWGFNKNGPPFVKVLKMCSKIHDYFVPLLQHLDTRFIMGIVDMQFSNNQLQFVRDILLHKHASIKALEYPIKTYIPKIWGIMKENGYEIESEYEKLLREEWNAFFALKVARLYVAIHSRQAALELLEKVVVDQNVISSDDHIYALTDLAKLCLEQELYKKCIGYYEKILELIPDAFLPNQVDYETSCLDNYALALGNLGRHSESHDILQKSLKSRVQNNGNNHVSVGYSYNNLGLHYTRCGKYEESTKAHQKSIEILSQVLHKEHPDIALVQSNLASALLKNGKLDEANVTYRQCLQVLEEKRGKNHPEVAAIMDNLGVICTRNGKPQQSFDYHLKALSIYQQVYGQQHPCLSGVFVNLAIASKEMAKYSKSEEYYQSALEIEKNHSSEENEAMASIIFNMALLFLAQRQPEKALPLFKESMRIREKVIGESAAGFLSSLRYVACTLNEIGQVDDALSHFIRLASIQKEHFADDPLPLATTYFNIGVLYYDKEQDKKSLEYFTLAYEIQEEELGDDDDETRQTLEYIEELKS